MSTFVSNTKALVVHSSTHPFNLVLLPQMEFLFALRFFFFSGNVQTASYTYMPVERGNWNLSHQTQFDAAPNQLSENPLSFFPQIIPRAIIYFYCG